VAPLLAPSAAVAQKWSADAGLSSQLEWTSNAAFGEIGGRSDTVIDIRPHIKLVGEGAQLKFSGSAALNAITYANRTQPSRLEPEADLGASLEAVRKFLFIDAALRSFQTSANPFGARAEAGATSENSVTTAQARLTPRIEGMTSERIRYRLRSDNSWTYVGGATAALAGSNSSGYFGQHAVSFEQDPLPLGWRIEAQRSETRYRDATLDPLVLDLARATLSYALGQDLSAGVHVGRERTSLDARNGNGTIYGVEAKWQPSPRNMLSVFEERRFFGSSWNLLFDHRTPGFAWNLVAARTLESAPQSVFNLPATDNVAALLDAMFTTRFPDPVERARIVQDLIARQGLPTSALQPISLQTQRLSVVNLNAATIALIGVRNTLALSGFQTRTKDAPDTNPLLNGGSLTNNNQYGASIALTHRLTPSTALTAAADWSRIRALAGLGDQQSTQRTARLRLNVAASPKTNVFAGTRYGVIDSNTVVSGHEGAAFVGLDHQF
jgi:uncharacterized protein (PEP-CTERM system associated)